MVLLDHTSDAKLTLSRGRRQDGQEHQGADNHGGGENVALNQDCHNERSYWIKNRLGVDH